MTWTLSRDTLKEDHLLNEESLYFNGNGYLGVRGNFEEDFINEIKSIRGTYINAFHDIVTIPYSEKLFAFPETQQKLVNIIDAQMIHIYFGSEENEERFTLDVGEVLSYKRFLHMDKGYTERKIHWRSPQGKEIKLMFKRLVSFDYREIFIQQIILEPVNFYGQVRISSTINGDVSNYIDQNDPRVSSGHAKRLTVTEAKQDGDVSYIEVKTLQSGLSAGCGTCYQLNASYQRKNYADEKSVRSDFLFELSSDVVFEKKNAYADTLRHGGNLFKAIKKIQDMTQSMNFLDFSQKQLEFLNKYWVNADIKIDGDPLLQEGIRFNLFHLLQSSGRDSVSNIAAKGLSGEGYEGHYFWDTEIYMFPMFLMTNPEIAKQLLLYRYTILEQAKVHANEMGHAKGALFPWRTITGTECSSFFPQGTAQYHISADIAYAFIQYYIVTNDQEFLQDYGAEILFETARLWVEVGHFKDGAFKIDAVTGPDEYTCIVNNNYYTNVMAKHNLKWAAKSFDILKSTAHQKLANLMKKIGLDEQEKANWEQAAKKMYLPYDKDLKMNPQDDSFLEKAVWDLEATPKDKFPLLLHYHPLTIYRYQVCKQADTVLAHFLLEDEACFKTIKNSYLYYEKVTTHDSSLSTCIFSIMAAKLGDHEKAYNYFIETARMDLENTHGNTKDGLHLANMGGTWLAIVFGFAGLRVKEEGIFFHPTLPKQWERYEFYLKFQGRKLKIEIANHQTSITLCEGEELPIHLFGTKYMISVENKVVINNRI